MSPDQERGNQPPTQFGVFYPRGYAVVAFADQASAQAAQQALIDGGYDPRDVFLSEAAEVLEHTTAHLSGVSALAKVAASEASVEVRHNELARKGATFLLAYAPSDLDTERLMNVIRRFRFQLAHKYDRFTLRELGP